MHNIVLTLKRNQITNIYISHMLIKENVMGEITKIVTLFTFVVMYYNVYELTLVNWYVTLRQKLLRKKYFGKFHSGKIYAGIVIKGVSKYDLNNCTIN